MQWFHCDSNTKKIIAYGIASEEDAILQPKPDEYNLYTLPEGMISRAFADIPNMVNLKQFLKELTEDTTLRENLENCNNLVDIMEMAKQIPSNNIA